MAEMAVSFAIDKLLPLLSEEANLLKSVHKQFADIKKELEYIQAFLKDADRRAVAEGGNNGEGVKVWVKEVREAAFRIEDIIDEYMILVEQQPRGSGCVALLCKIARVVKTLKQRHQIASEIQDIKSSVCAIKERSARYGFQIQPSFEQGSSSSKGGHNSKSNDPRMAALYVEEAEVVGFEEPKETLIGWLVKGREECVVISVVGMGGQGKTTLARKVFDSKEVFGHFEYRAWITVSQSYTVEGLLRDMLHQIYKQKRNDPPHHIFQMDQRALIDEVRNHLQNKRYVVVFDNVWNANFWDEIQFAVADVKNRSRIIMTTRDINVVMSCKKSSFIEVHNLQPLTEEQSLELFYKKAFFDLNGCCPEKLITISSEIVKKCEGLPLGIITIGGLLCGKDRDALQWQMFSENLSSELMKDSLRIKKILGMSFDDLPYNLKSCFLYFGIYPEDYLVKSKRLIRQWIAEGFVKGEKGKTLEEVAKGYLIELIHRSLVQVASITVDGKPKGCRVHDMLRVVILEKFEDLSFCHHVSVDGRSPLSGMIRRLSLTTISNDSIASIESPHVRSLLVFTDEELPKQFVRRILTKYRLLKVLDFQDTLDFNVPRNLASFIHLKYLSLRNVYLYELPKSIGMLLNLETLDLRGTSILKMPKEISKLRKLRHLLGNEMSLDQLKCGIGHMTSLQTLYSVGLYEDEVVELIRELAKLKQLRELGFIFVRGEHGSTLGYLINEMQHLEKLLIKSESKDIVVNLHLSSPLPVLRNLSVRAKLEKLPEWILGLQNLIKLKLECSQLIDDPMNSLQNMPNLLSLSIGLKAYVGESLHFQDGGFKKLKELYIYSLNNLNSTVIDKGALHSLKKLELFYMPKLKEIPNGIRHLEKLEVLKIEFTPLDHFVKSLDIYRGNVNEIIKHVPLVEISTIHGNHKVIRSIRN